VIPDIPSLQWIPRDAAVLYQPDTSGLALACALNSLADIADEKLLKARTTATSFASKNSWTSVAERHLSLYTEILNEQKI
jgi:hypothetical protein